MQEHEALRLHARLSDQEIQGSFVIDDEYVSSAYSRWLPKEKGLCRFPTKCRANPKHDFTACEGYRCNADYWRNHGREVGQIMRIIAPFVDGDAEEYRRVGELHDVDYLDAPHDVPQGEASESHSIHPCPLVEELERKGARRDVLIAILEHSPHSRPANSATSTMSRALFFADNFVTCRSAGCPIAESSDFPWPTTIPERLSKLLKDFRARPIKDTTTSSASRWRIAVEAIESLFD